MRPPLRPPDDEPSAATSPVASDADPIGSLRITTSELLGFSLTPPSDPHEDDLPPREALFVAELCRNGFNATHAYAAAGFTGGRHNAARLWRKPRIQAALKAKLAARIMAGDEALAMLSLQARFDIRKLFPADSKIAQLPDDVALAIKSVYMTKYGQRIEFHDAQRAAELLAKAGGKLKETVKVEHTLEDILARSYRVEAQAS